MQKRVWLTVNKTRNFHCMNSFWKLRLDHVLFWTLTIVFHSYTHSGIIYKAGWIQFVLELVVRNGLLALVIYTALLIIIPKFLEKKKYIPGAALLLLALFVYVAVKNAHDVYLYGNITGDAAKSNFINNSFYNFSIVLFYLCFSVSLHLSKQWYLQKELIRKIQLEKLNTELEYLKAQINPHFLFNSINTIYFQIDKQNQIARETLSTFSDMLRYQLYECNGHEIPVDREIAYLRNYVEIQRMRKDENYSIDFRCDPAVSDFTIPPLLLIPFIENAFKHVSHFTHKTNQINIDVRNEGDTFYFKVFNTKDISRSTNKNNGIGLRNVKRRLELLYQDRHALNIAETEDTFTVMLELQTKTAAQK